jgi:hypothetical protein
LTFSRVEPLLVEIAPGFVFDSLGKYAKLLRHTVLGALLPREFRFLQPRDAFPLNSKIDNITHATTQVQQRKTGAIEIF